MQLKIIMKDHIILIDLDVHINTNIQNIACLSKIMSISNF